MSSRANPIPVSNAHLGQTAHHDSDTALPTADTEKQEIPPIKNNAVQPNDPAQPAETSRPISKRSASQTAPLMVALCVRRLLLQTSRNHPRVEGLTAWQQISVLLAALDIAIITTPLPTISSHFHSSTGYVWIGSAFLLGSGASGPTWGKLSDIFGRRPLILSAAAIFLLGSTICGASTSVAMLIAGRAL